MLSKEELVRSGYATCPGCPDFGAFVYKQAILRLLPTLID